VLAHALVGQLLEPSFCCFQLPRQARIGQSAQPPRVGGAALY